MSLPSHDFVTVDMRGMKAALVTRAQAERVSVSKVVRRAIGRELGLGDVSPEAKPPERCAPPLRPLVKLSMRLTHLEAERLDASARRSGLSRGAFVAGLLADVPALTGGAVNRLDSLAALNASCAELSTLSRNLHHLTSLFRPGQAQPALQYRRMFDTLSDDVRAHLRVAAGALAELRPARRD